MPKPGQMMALSTAYSPVVLKGIKLDPKNPFRFQFFVDTGSDMSLRGASFATRQSIKEQSSKLIKYFLASLTIPEKDLWVNLSPYEKNRIVPQEFGQTEMGRDLLAEDYILKQITASLIYPESRLGREFWNKVYEKAEAKYGTTNIPINTFNKVWIMPEKAVVYEKGGVAFVLENHLKVMLEEDYLSLAKHGVIASEAKQSFKEIASLPSASRNDTSELGCQIIREIVIPALTKEVNEGKNFAKLRQVFYSLILATWYKQKIKDSILNKVYSNRNKVWNLSSPNVLIGEPEHIYQQYLKAFKKGVYNYIKEEPDTLTNQMIPRKYFSGGIIGEPNIFPVKNISKKDFGQLGSIMRLNVDFALTGLAKQSKDGAMKANAKIVQDPRPLVASWEQAMSLIKTAPLENFYSIKRDDKPFFYRGVYSETAFKDVIESSYVRTNGYSMRSGWWAENPSWAIYNATDYLNDLGIIFVLPKSVLKNKYHWHEISGDADPVFQPGPVDIKDVAHVYLMMCVVHQKWKPEEKIGHMIEIRLPGMKLVSASAVSVRKPEQKPEIVLGKAARKFWGLDVAMKAKPGNKMGRRESIETIRFKAWAEKNRDRPFLDKTIAQLGPKPLKGAKGLSQQRKSAILKRGNYGITAKGQGNHLPKKGINLSDNRKRLDAWFLNFPDGKGYSEKKIAEMFGFSAALIYQIKKEKEVELIKYLMTKNTHKIKILADYGKKKLGLSSLAFFAKIRLLAHQGRFKLSSGKVTSYQPTFNPDGTATGEVKSYWAIFGDYLNQSDEWHKGAHVYVFSPTGELYLQVRHNGTLDASAGGSVEIGLNGRGTGIEEAEQEIDLDIQRLGIQPSRLKAVESNGRSKNGIYYLDFNNSYSPQGGRFDSTGIYHSKGDQKNERVIIEPYRLDLRPAEEARWMALVGRDVFTLNDYLKGYRRIMNNEVSGIVKVSLKDLRKFYSINKNRVSLAQGLKAMLAHPSIRQAILNSDGAMDSAEQGFSGIFTAWDSITKELRDFINSPPDGVPGELWGKEGLGHIILGPVVTVASNLNLAQMNVDKEKRGVDLKDAMDALDRLDRIITSLADLSRIYEPDGNLDLGRLVESMRNFLKSYETWDEKKRMAFRANYYIAELVVLENGRFVRELELRSKELEKNFKEKKAQIVTLIEEIKRTDIKGHEAAGQGENILGDDAAMKAVNDPKELISLFPILHFIPVMHLKEESGLNPTEKRALEIIEHFGMFDIHGDLVYDHQTQRGIIISGYSAIGKSNITRRLIKNKRFSMWGNDGIIAFIDHQGTLYASYNKLPELANDPWYRNEENEAVTFFNGKSLQSGFIPIGSIVYLKQDPQKEVFDIRREALDLSFQKDRTCPVSSTVADQINNSGIATMNVSVPQDNRDYDSMADAIEKLLPDQEMKASARERVIEIYQIRDLLGRFVEPMLSSQEENDDILRLRGLIDLFMQEMGIGWQEVEEQRQSLYYQAQGDPSALKEELVGEFERLENFAEINKLSGVDRGRCINVLARLQVIILAIDNVGLRKQNRQARFKAIQPMIQRRMEVFQELMKDTDKELNEIQGLVGQLGQAAVLTNQQRRKIKDLADSLSQRFSRDSSHITLDKNLPFDVEEKFAKIIGLVPVASQNIDLNVDNSSEKANEIILRNAGTIINVRNRMVYYLQMLRDLLNPLGMDRSVDRRQWGNLGFPATVYTNFLIPMLELGDFAMKANKNIVSLNGPGGIDLNPADMSMQVKKEGEDFKFDFNGTEMDAAQVTGATFTIRSMTPVTNLPLSLGLN